MIQKFKKFTKLSVEEKKLFLEAYYTLGKMRAAILAVSFKRLTRSLKHHPRTIDMPMLNEKEIALAKQVGLAIVRASRYTPWESACLVQSLTAQKMLQKRDVCGVFYLGVAKDKENNDKMNAHAWTECGNEILTGKRGHEAFTVVSVFGWGNK